LRIERQQERDDRNTLMIYRLMYDTHAMTAGSDYIEMAQLLGDAALSGEAQRVLQQALSGGFIGNEQKERTNRLLTQLKTRADTDRASLTQLDADAAENPAGELDVKLGELYYGSGDYENAIKAITRGLQKGFVNHPDDGYVYLGRAQRHSMTPRQPNRLSDRLSPRQMLARGSLIFGSCTLTHAPRASDPRMPRAWSAVGGTSNTHRAREDR
jgi:hypothetical protein